MFIWDNVVRLSWRAESEPAEGNEWMRSECIVSVVTRLILGVVSSLVDKWEKY